MNPFRFGDDSPSGDESPAVKFVADESDTQDTGVGASIPSELPILPLRGMVVYPQTAMPLTINQPRSVKLIDAVATGERLVG